MRRQCENQHPRGKLVQDSTAKAAPRRVGAVPEGPRENLEIYVASVTARHFSLLPKRVRPNHDSKHRGKASILRYSAQPPWVLPSGRWMMGSHFGDGINTLTSPDAGSIASH